MSKKPKPTSIEKISDKLKAPIRNVGFQPFSCKILVFQGILLKPFNTFVWFRTKYSTRSSDSNNSSDVNDKLNS